MVRTEQRQADHEDLRVSAEAFLLRVDEGRSAAELAEAVAWIRAAVERLNKRAA
jgi:hypothetical protein